MLPKTWIPKSLSFSNRTKIHGLKVVFRSENITSFSRSGWVDIPKLLVCDVVSNGVNFLLELNTGPKPECKIYSNFLSVIQVFLVKAVKSHIFQLIYLQLVNMKVSLEFQNHSWFMISLNIVKTGANFQACENILVIMETFILKGRRAEILTKTSCIIKRYPRIKSSISLRAASVPLESFRRPVINISKSSKRVSLYKCYWYL